jgi:hypothetical protein
LEGKSIGLNATKELKRRAHDLKNQHTSSGPRQGRTQGFNLLQMSLNWFLQIGYWLPPSKAPPHTAGCLQPSKRPLDEKTPFILLVGESLLPRASPSLKVIAPRMVCYNEY